MNKSQTKKVLPVLVFIILLLLSLLILIPIPIASAEKASTSATVLNAAPTLKLNLSPDDDLGMPGVQVINPDPAANKTVTITANVSDLNGYEDIKEVIAEITGQSNVSDSPVILAFVHSVNITTAIYTGIFNLSNHAVGEYTVNVTATDSNGAVATCTGSICYSLAPDLTLKSSDISFSPTSPGEGDLVNITAVIHNIGGVDADNFTVSFFDGTFLIGNDTISVGANSNEIAMIEWTAVSGDREISVIVDSENKISESNETNNKASKVIYVRPISPCYIATATYGTPLDENINVLRDFRDAVLMTNPVGEAFVSTYYATSPPIADALRANEGLRTVTRLTLITPLVYLSEFALSGILLMFSIGLAVGILLRRDRMKILKSLLVGTGSILVFIAAIFSLGFAGHTIPFCAGIGAYLLPFVIPLSVIFTLCRVLNLNIVFITN
jgi:hypothetical protein